MDINLTRILALFLIGVATLGCENAVTPGSNNSTDPTNNGGATNLTSAEQADEGSKTDSLKTTVRFATYNVSLNRQKQGELLSELKSGNSDQAKKIAEVIQRTRPDVLLLNEFDYDQKGAGIDAFQTLYLRKSQHEQNPIGYSHIYFAPVNTGYDSGHDLDKNGKQGEPTDAFGFGQFPGKYAMVVLSRYPIDVENVRTFQKFLWKDMPDNQWPVDPETNKSYYSDEVKAIFRLSSKSHWDVPIKIGEKTIHLLASHPTPPAFDGPEDRNGARNHDEIRMFTDYVGGTADYLYDDKGVKGGLEKGAHFVIAGDLNADPFDGDGNGKAAQQLMTLKNVQVEEIPASSGGPHYAKAQGKANDSQQGNPAYDTADFGDVRPGNLRVDYCLPSKTLTLKATGVYWPKPDEPGGDLVGASDHRMVWIDIE